MPREELRALRDVVADDEITLQFVTDAVKLEEIATLTARADRRLFADPAYRRELARWIDRGALGHSWVKAKVGAAVIRYLNVGRQQARSDAELLRNAPVVAVLRTPDDDRKSQIRAGQAFQRVSLLATARDVRTHPMSALLEVPALRRELTDLLGTNDGAGTADRLGSADRLGTTDRFGTDDWPPQHLFRLGYADDSGENDAGEDDSEETPPSPRRPANAVLVD